MSPETTCLQRKKMLWPLGWSFNIASTVLVIYIQMFLFLYVTQVMKWLVKYKCGLCQTHLSSSAFMPDLKQLYKIFNKICYRIIR